MFHKNLQAQNRKQKCKAQVFNHLQFKYNLCHLCLCLILRVPRWIGQWIMACITCSSNGYEVWEYSWLWTCNVTWVKEMQESHSLEWWFWDGSVCFLVLANNWPLLRYNMVQVWSILQATSKWSQSQIWPVYKLQTREQICRWVVQCSTSRSVSCKIPTIIANILHWDIF